jgi:hypothetical protein
MNPKKETPERELWLDEIVSLTEAASLRKVSVETLRALIRNGKLRAVEQSKRKRGMRRREALRDDLR